MHDKQLKTTFAMIKYDKDHEQNEFLKLAVTATIIALIIACSTMYSYKKIKEIYYEYHKNKERK